MKENNNTMTAKYYNRFKGQAHERKVNNMAQAKCELEQVCLLMGWEFTAAHFEVVISIK